MLRFASHKPIAVSRRGQQGLTLVELVIAIVVLSIALYSSLQAFSLLAGRNADAMLQTRSLDLAQMYFDEILAKPWDELTGPGGVPPFETCREVSSGQPRALFRSVSDYHNLIEQPALADQSLAALYEGFTVSVQVRCDNSVGVNGNGAKRIELVVTSPQGEQARFAAYRGNY